MYGYATVSYTQILYHLKFLKGQYVTTAILKVKKANLGKLAFVWSNYE